MNFYEKWINQFDGARKHHNTLPMEMEATDIFICVCVCVCDCLSKQLLFFYPKKRKQVPSFRKEKTKKTKNGFLIHSQGSHWNSS